MHHYLNACEQVDRRLRGQIELNDDPKVSHLSKTTAKTVNEGKRISLCGQMSRQGAPDATASAGYRNIR